MSQTNKLIFFGEGFIQREGWDWVRVDARITDDTAYRARAAWCFVERWRTGLLNEQDVSKCCPENACNSNSQTRAYSSGVGIDTFCVFRIIIIRRRDYGVKNEITMRDY